MPRLIPFGPEVWTARQDLSLLGANFGARMTTVRDQSGNLTLISPIAMTPELVSELSALGRVRFVIAPNTFHHVYLNQCRRHFPDALFFAPASLVRKRRDFQFDGTVEEGQEYPWSRELEFLVFFGSPAYSEILFYHPRSKSLVTTDLVMNFQVPRGIWEWLLFSVLGLNRRLAPSRLMRVAFVRDKVQSRAALERALKWDFDRVILAHGELVTAGARERLTAGLKPLIGRHLPGE